MKCQSVWLKKWFTNWNIFSNSRAIWVAFITFFFSLHFRALDVAFYPSSMRFLASLFSFSPLIVRVLHITVTHILQSPARFCSLCYTPRTFFLFLFQKSEVHFLALRPGSSASKEGDHKMVTSSFEPAGVIWCAVRGTAHCGLDLVAAGLQLCEFSSWL